MIDTNILLDWLLDRDPVRTKKVDRLFSSSDELWVPDIVFVELAFALEKFYCLPRPLVGENLQKVIDEPALTLSGALFRGVLTVYLSHSSLSFLDCCLLKLAEQESHGRVWTFDKKLIAKSSGLAKAPE